MKVKIPVLAGVILLGMVIVSAQYVTDPLPYAPIANPLPDTMDQLQRDSFNIVFSPIRINQAGYRPQDKKYFYYVGSASDFTVIGADGKTVGTGKLTQTGKTASGQLKIKASNNAQLVTGGDTRYTMESPVYSGPISEGIIPDLPPGVYQVVVGNDTSHKFIIDERVYSWVRDALLKFYGVNRCGDSQSWFHAACHLKDGVTGGWHDCGDHLKEAATMSYTAAVLGLAAAVFFDRDVDVYSANQGITQITDGIPDILYEAKHGADFVLQSYDKADGQVGKMVTSVGGFGIPGYGDDHSWWGRPENQDKMPASRGGPPRPARVEPTTDYLGKYAANLAFVSKRMRPYDSDYADRCLEAAIAIYEFTKPRIDKTDTPAYNGGTNVSDDAAFACLALLWATGERKYLDELCYDKVIGALGKPETDYPKLFQGGWFTNYDPVFSHSSANTDWASTQAHVLWGFFRLVLNDEALCKNLGLAENDRLALIEKTVYNLIANLSSVGLGLESIQLPDNGFWVPPVIKYELPWFTMHTQMEWVYNRYQAGNITEMYYYYDIASKIKGLELPSTPASENWKEEEVKTILVRMMDYMFGVNPWDISMVYGVGDKNFNHPHHRAANPEGKNVPGAFYKYVPPVGALQGGYKPVSTLYSEHYDDYHHSETGIDGTTNLLMPVVGLAKEDTIAPPSGSVRILYVGCDEAIIEVRQSRYGTAIVQYGKEDVLDNIKKSDSSAVLHRIVLSGLTNGTTYNFNAVVTDVFGRDSVIKNLNEDRNPVNFTFTTQQNCPTNAEITNVKVCRVTHDSAEIFWYTPNGEYDSKVVYGEQKPPTTVHDGDVSGHPVKFHYVKIGGLKEKTTYYFYVESGDSRDDNNGQLYTFRTPVMHVEFDVRMLRYNWGELPGVGINIVNQDSKDYDSLEARLYFRAQEGFEDDLAARLDICVLYREDGYQQPIEGELREAVFRNFYNSKPIQMTDTYNAEDQTYAYYLALPLWGIKMHSQSRIRLDVIFDSWEPERKVDHLELPPKHKISDSDWSFGPHSKADGDPVDYPGAPTLPKTDVDATYFNEPVNYYVTIYRKEEYVWGYSPSKVELSTKKTHYTLETQITSPINNPSADYYLYEGSGKTINVKGYAKLTPVDGRINDIWVNGVPLSDLSSVVSLNQVTGDYNLNIPIPVKNGRNLVDITIFGGPSEDCQDCYGCASTNHSFFIEAPFIQQYPSQLSVKDINLNSINDTVKIDTTVFHILVTDKNGNINRKAKDTLWASVYNPINKDSNVVILIETADSSNVFQTATPISVVSLPPDQTGTDKISMSGAERLTITYIDPTDESDISRASLYSRAEFPVPVRGWIKDSNGNGTVDQMGVLYNQTVNTVPDSIQFDFPNTSSQRVLVSGRDEFKIYNGNMILINFNGIKEQQTGYSSGLTGTGKSYVIYNGKLKSTLFPVTDSAGPVLMNSAMLHERVGENIVNDTLTVTFTEAVDIDKLTGDILLLRKDGVDSPVDVIQHLSMIPGKNIVTLLVKSNRDIDEGDSVLINPMGNLTDLSGNSAHPENKPVFVKIKIAVPQIIKACYRDIDVDGVIDRVDILFNKVVIPSECNFVFNWKTKEGIQVTGENASLVDSDPKAIHINVRDVVVDDNAKATSGLMSIKITNQQFGETTFATVDDSAGPMLMNSAILYERYNENVIGDTLTVTFTEAVYFDKLVGEVLLLRKDGVDSPIDVIQLLSMIPGTNSMILLVKSSRDVEDGDSVLIDPTGNLTDLSGNSAHPMNKPVAVKVKIAAPQIVNACYRDIDADGVIDRVDILLNKNIVASECDFVFNWKSKEGIQVTGEKASAVDSDPKAMYIHVREFIVDNFSDNNTLATSGSMSVKIKNQLFGETTFATVYDSAAPVIVSALFQMSVTPNSDTLHVTFSERTKKVTDSPFILSDQQGTQYSFTCVDNGGGVLESRTFIVTGINNVEYPNKNDSIWIDPQSLVNDLNGNIQNNEFNKRALLKIGQVPLVLNIYSGPNPFIPDVSSISTDNDLPEAIAGKKGFLVQINMTSGKRKGIVSKELKGQVFIVDGVGRVIYTGFIQKGKMPESTSYYFYWDGTNKYRRVVGTGTYIMHIETQTIGKDIGDTVQKRVDKIKIGVKREIE